MLSISSIMIRLHVEDLPIRHVLQRQATYDELHAVQHSCLDTLRDVWKVEADSIAMSALPLDGNYLACPWNCSLDDPALRARHRAPLGARLICGCSHLSFCLLRCLSLSLSLPPPISFTRTYTYTHSYSFHLCRVPVAHVDAMALEGGLLLLQRFIELVAHYLDVRGLASPARLQLVRLTSLDAEIRLREEVWANRVVV